MTELPDIETQVTMQWRCRFYFTLHKNKPVENQFSS